MASEVPEGERPASIIRYYFTGCTRLEFPAVVQLISLVVVLHGLRRPGKAGNFCLGVITG